jgi:2-dehydro-3-deoxygluconokinase
MNGPTVVALGEFLLRLKPPAHERLFQSPVLEAAFGGAEANVAVSLVHFGVASSFVTALPPNAVGDAALGELRRQGVAVAHVARTGERLGIYYHEAGAAHRPSRVIYDRSGSSLATVDPASFDWDVILEGARWFHVSGITPAISASAAELVLRAVRAARQRGVTVSCDYNFRANLWKWGRTAPEVMHGIMQHVDVGIAGREDCQRALGIGLETMDDAVDPDMDHYRRLAQKVLDTFPSLRMQVITLRSSHSATRHGWSACLLDRAGHFHASRRYEIGDVVDRVGAGDAFSAGLIYGLLEMDESRALEFAVAASCLKHTIPGDFNRVSIAEVTALLGGDAGGRVQR